MSMLLKNFNRQFTVIRLQQFGTPRLANILQMDLPRGSIFHYPPNDLSEVGPAQSLPLIDKAEKLVMINHITNLASEGTIGRPIPLTQPLERDIIHYHRMNKKLRRMRDDNLVTRDPRTLLVENYALLSRRYRYQQTIMSWYERWYNTYLTVVSQIAVDAEKYDRQNYLMLNVPDVIPSIMALRRGELRRDKVSLEKMQDPNCLFMLDLWTWLGANRNKSVLGRLSEEAIKRVNIILVYKDKFVNLNLGELEFWRKDDDGKGLVKPDQMQRRLYKTTIELATMQSETVPSDVTSKTSAQVIETLPEITAETDEELDELPELRESTPAEQFELPAPVDIDTSDLESLEAEIQQFDEQAMDESEDFEVVKQDVVAKAVTDVDQPLSLEQSVLKECDRYIEAGMLSTREFQRVTALAAKYHEIQNPYGQGTLADMLHVDPIELKIKPEVLLDDPTLLDKSMAISTTLNFNKQYLDNTMPKDIVGSVLALQKAGIIVTDYQVEDVVDAANRVHLHTVKVTPVNGESATLRFTTPAVDDQGYWTANDITYTMRKQRVDFK